MGILQNIWQGRKQLISIILSGILLFAASLVTLAQEPPPRPVTVTVTQNLSFGAFYQGAAGGTVTINSAGVRSATGDVVLLLMGYSVSTAIYRVVGTPGTVVSLLNGPDVALTGPGSMNLHIGASNPVWPFVITTVPPAYMELNVGGILTVSSPLANPPGSYSGTFDITFVQE